MDRSAVDRVFPPLRLLPVPVPHSVLDRPYFTDVVFPTGNIFVLDSMSCLGLIYYTFTVGVEIELPTVVRVGLQSFWFAAASSLRGPQHRRLPPEKGYSEAVNVVGFLYSVFQLFALAVLMRRKKHLIPRPKGDYFDFIMDQVLAYLLISSSSSATARVGDWMDNWGSDPFPNMANSSIAISFLAFLVFAISSLISAYNLFRRDL